MKKLLALLSVGAMVLSFAACSKTETSEAPENTQGEVQEEKEEVSNLIGSWTGMYGKSTAAGAPDNSEPNKLTLTFEEDGKGMLTYFSSTTEFEWTEGEDGSVVCTYLDEKFIETYKRDKFEAKLDGDVLTGGLLYGFEFTVAKDGTDAADPALYVPEA